ncbi:MAG: PEP-CTERM sorting domain-containing protein, partial [Cyanobacteria bacterium P01_D01_bin.6]
LSESDGDNSLYRFNFDAQGVKQLSVIYPGSGAIAALRWEQEQAPPTIPEPAAIVGLLAIAGFGLRRKQQSQTV